MNQDPGCGAERLSKRPSGEGACAWPRAFTEPRQTNRCTPARPLARPLTAPLMQKRVESDAGRAFPPSLPGVPSCQALLAHARVKSILRGGEEARTRRRIT